MNLKDLNIGLHKFGCGCSKCKTRSPRYQESVYYKDKDREDSFDLFDEMESCTIERAFNN